MNFSEALKSEKFVITAEIFPPKGVDLTSSLNKAKELKGIVDAINVTDNQRAVMRMNPLVLCHQAIHNGIDAIYQMCCRDRNSMGLSSDALAAHALGIKNILAITGDYPLRNGKVLAKPVFELDSVQLIDMIKKLEKGIDFNGASLENNPSFCVGGVVNPNSEQLELQILKLRKKIDAGAEFIQTQVVYDVEIFKKFKDKLANLGEAYSNTPVLLGIFPLKSAQMARFMDEKVPGVRVGEKVIKKMENSKNPEQEGIEIAVNVIRELKSFCRGVHFMTMNDVEVVKEIVSRV